MIINSNIKRVVYATLYPDTDSLDFFRDAGVEVKYIHFEIKCGSLAKSKPTGL